MEETSGNSSSKCKCTPRKLTISSLFIILFVGFVIAFAYIWDSPAAKRMRTRSEQDEEIEVVVVNDVDGQQITIIPTEIPTISPAGMPNTLSIGPTVIAEMNTIQSPTLEPRITNRPTGTLFTDFLFTLPASSERTSTGSTTDATSSSENDSTNDKPYIILNPNTRQKYKKTWKQAKNEKTSKTETTPEITMPSGKKTTKALSSTSNVDESKSKATKVSKQMKSKSEKSEKSIYDKSTKKESKSEKKQKRDFVRTASNTMIII